ncbi:MAG: prenyltransferase [Desulfurococcales archaeon]|nr:prenyltransferase [Desulfurococcales archaeon]
MKPLRMLWHSFRKCRVPENSEDVNVIVKVVAASRLCVVPMTFYAVTIGGLIAWISDSFDPLLYLAILVGFVGAHLVDNFINDYYDYKRGFDDPSYFRTLYGPHPLLDNIVAPRTIRNFIALVLVYDLLLTLYLSIKVTPIIALLSAIGVLVMLLYAGFPVDAKRLGIGELLVAIVWGPVMVGGTIYAMTGNHTILQALVYLPFALSVSLVLIGKHLDKYEHDKGKGLYTLPVRLGLDPARKLSSILSLVLPPLAAISLYVYEQSIFAVLPLASTLIALYAVRLYKKPKPTSPPKGWDVWPLWYVAAGYMVMDSLGRTMIASLFAYGLTIHGYTVLSWMVFVAGLLFELLIGWRLNTRNVNGKE